MTNIEGINLAKRVGEILDEKKAEKMLLLDVREVSSVTDFFLIATGTSAPHLKALSEEVEVQLKKEGARAYRHSGDPESGWMILDYFDLVVHIFTPEVRSYYDLERLWRDAPQITVDNPATPA